VRSPNARLTHLGGQFLLALLSFLNCLLLSLPLLLSVRLRHRSASVNPCSKQLRLDARL